MYVLIVVALMWTKAGSDINVTYQNFESSVTCQSAASTLQKISKLKKAMNIYSFCTRKQNMVLGIADSVIGVAGKVLDKFVEDKDLKKKLEHELQTQIFRPCSSTGKYRTGQTSLYLCQRSKTSYHVGMLLCSGMAVYSCTYSILDYYYLVSYGNASCTRD